MLSGGLLTLQLSQAPLPGHTSSGLLFINTKIDITGFEGRLESLLPEVRRRARLSDRPPASPVSVSVPHILSNESSSACPIKDLASRSGIFFESVTAG